MKERAQARREELAPTKRQCQGRGNDGRCKLYPIFDGKWCPWHAEVVIFGKSQRGGFSEFEKWLTRELERKDYRWKMHTPQAWWDLVNGRDTTETPACTGCGVILLTLRRGVQPFFEKNGVFCDQDCWAEAVAKAAIA